jgi:hypothetical protein
VILSDRKNQVMLPWDIYPGKILARYQPPLREGNGTSRRAFDAIRMRDYIWRYPRRSYLQECRFNLGNPDEAAVVFSALD